MTSGRSLFEPKLGVVIPLSALPFVFFFLITQDVQKAYTLFAFFPETALVHPWSFVTYQFLYSSPMPLFFGALGFYILGSGLEGAWGTRGFVVFWLVGTVGGALAAWALGVPLQSGAFTIHLSMLFAFAYLFPDTYFMVFFVVPVKVKWIAWVSAAVLGGFCALLLLGGAPGRALTTAVGATAGFLWFWIREHGRYKARRAAREAVTAVKSAGASRQDEALERRNRELFPKVERLRAEARAATAPASGPAGSGLPTLPHFSPSPDLSPEARRLASELATLVVPGVKICKPVDFKGDKDLICLRCEGFAECSLRYVAGKPSEIVVREREG